MITRKAILSAFEIITAYPTAKIVTVFVGLERIFLNIERVRISRVCKGKDQFRVMLGKCNRAELKFLKSASGDGKPLPKHMIIVYRKNKKAA